MTLIKTSLLNAIAVAIKMLTMLGINKILAIYVGPAGYAALGNFQNLLQMVTTFASGAVNIGVTKYTAEYAQDKNKQILIWKTAGTISLIGVLISSLLIFYFSKYLATFFLKDESLGSIFVYLSITLVFFVFNYLLLAILNGKKEILSYVIANVIGSVFALLVTAILVKTSGVYGALISLVIYQSFSFFATLFIIYRLKWFSVRYLFGGFDREIAVKLAKFTAMALVSAVCVPLSQILIRDHLTSELGADAAGLWEAMWRLSSAYLLLITTTLGVYFLPKFSELTTERSIKKEILNGFKLIVPVIIVFGLIVLLLKNFIIKTLFSEKFMPMGDLFAWQMVGDFFKISSWVISYLMLSKAMVKLYIYTEIIFTAFFYFLVYEFVEYYGLRGTVIAHAINYIVYFVVIYKLVFRKISKDNIL